MFPNLAFVHVYVAAGLMFECVCVQRSVAGALGPCLYKHITQCTVTP